MAEWSSETEEKFFWNKNMFKKNIKRKNKLMAATKNKQMEELAKYSSCQGIDNPCNCKGYKHHNQSLDIGDDDQRLNEIGETCRACKHSKRSHYKHLQELPLDRIHELLGYVVDLESLYECLLLNPEDDFRRDIYVHLYKKLKEEADTLTDKMRGFMSKVLARFLNDFEATLWDDESYVWDAERLLTPADFPRFVVGDGKGRPGGGGGGAEAGKSK
ncbi:unnamed protein product, partial [Notodromas monacha]